MEPRSLVKKSLDLVTLLELPVSLLNSPGSVASRPRFETCLLGKNKYLNWISLSLSHGFTTNIFLWIREQMALQHFVLQT